MGNPDFPILKKEELIPELSERLGWPPARVEKTLNAFWAFIQESIRNGKELRLEGFGTFSSKIIKEHCKPLPEKKKYVRIGEHKRATFKPSPALRKLAAQAPAVVEQVRRPKKKGRTAAKALHLDYRPEALFGSRREEDPSGNR